MAKFNFHVDEKVSIWNRVHFEIEAESKEAAIEYIKKHRKFNSYELESQIASDMDKDVEFIETETLYETSENLSPSDNGGQATLEFYDEDNELIATNEEENE